jgi:ribosome-associated protein
MRELVLNDDVSLPLAEIEVRTSRSSGPGGQHANVTASRVEVVFDVAASATLTDEQRRRIECSLGERVTAVAQDARSQRRNRELALERLREKLTTAITPPRERRETRPTRASRERRLDAKRARSGLKRSRRPISPDEG